MKDMRTSLTALLFFLIATVALTIIAAPSASAERIGCFINENNTDPSRYERVDNVTTQGHYSGGTIFHLFCSKNWDHGTGNASYRFVDPGHVQEPSYNTFPNDAKLGRSVIDCEYEAGGTPGQCSENSDICAFTMSGDQNAHIADCDQNELPPSTSYKGTLCCTVQEICTDGKDNDGDGLVDCADPECNGADANTTLEPFTDDGPQVCHPNTCPATLHEGLEGFWQFENTTQDASGNENDGSLNGATYTNHIDGKHGLALEFGPGQDFSVPDDTSFYKTLDPTNAISLSAYVNPDGSTGGIIAKGSAYKLYMSGGDAYIDIDSGSIGPVNLGNIPTGEWTHIAVTYNSSSTTLTGYIDGTSTTTTTATGTLPNSNADLRVGYDGTNYFDGRIDQPRVYSRDLSASEVSSFTDYKCNNRQRTVECVNNPELCDTPYNNTDGDNHANYHCNYGQYDDPTADGSYANLSDKGTGVCCPRNQIAKRDPLTNDWDCGLRTTCGIESGSTCEYNISANEDAYFNDTYQDSGSGEQWCQQQIPKADGVSEQPQPNKSSACCYVYKQGRYDYWFKDGNVKVYG